jgi:hypothetical protein
MSQTGVSGRKLQNFAGAVSHLEPERQKLPWPCCPESAVYKFRKPLQRVTIIVTLKYDQELRSALVGGVLAHREA